MNGLRSAVAVGRPRVRSVEAGEVTSGGGRGYTPGQGERSLVGLELRAASAWWRASPSERPDMRSRSGPRRAVPVRSVPPQPRRVAAPPPVLAGAGRAGSAEVRGRGAGGSRVRAPARRRSPQPAMGPRAG